MKNLITPSLLIRSIASMLLLVVMVSCNSKEREKSALVISNAKTDEPEIHYTENGEWWTPILEKQNLTLDNIKVYGNLVESGMGKTLIDSVVAVTEAVFIIKHGPLSYSILESPSAYHDIKGKSIVGDSCVFTNYNMSGMPSRALEIQGFIIQLPTEDNSKLNIKGSKLKPHKIS